MARGDKTLARLRKLPYVAHVDDERDCGNSIIVTLKDGYYFENDPGCGVRGFDTPTEAAQDCVRSNIYKE